jgi:serine/threonine protein phosphatase PrpC
MGRYKVFWTDGPGDLEQHHNVTVLEAIHPQEAMQKVINQEQNHNNCKNVTIHRVDAIKTGEN